MAPATDDWASRRRIEPLNDLLRPTVRWMLRLPAKVRPFHLCHRYARIGNQLAACWTEPDATLALLFDLLHDRRGGRRGLPADITAELIALHAYYLRLHRTARPDAEARPAADAAARPASEAAARPASEAVQVSDATASIAPKRAGTARLTPLPIAAATTLDTANAGSPQPVRRLATG